jgi:phage gpG-like protein
MAEFTLLSMAKHFTAISAAMPMAEHAALDHASKLILEECKAEIGTYQSAAGPFAGWAPLKPSTIARKANGDTPLLETGEMRDSYERSIGIGEARVGSNNDKAVYHELGTRNIPARSVIGIAAVHKEKQIHKDTGRRFYGLLTAPNTAAIATVVKSEI